MLICGIQKPCASKKPMCGCPIPSLNYAVGMGIYPDRTGSPGRCNFASSGSFSYSRSVCIEQEV